VSIALQDLCVSYGPRCVLHNVNLNAHSGRVLLPMRALKTFRSDHGAIESVAYNAIYMCATS